MTNDYQAEIIERHYADIQRVYSLPHNTKLREGHAAWLQHVKTFAAQSPSELLDLVIPMIESYQSALRINENTIHYLAPAQQIADLYRKYSSQQRQELLQQLKHVIAIGEPLFERPHTYKDWASQCFSHIVKILEDIQAIWDVQQRYHSDLNLPPELLQLMDQYVEDLGPYRGLNFEERKDLQKNIRLEMVQKFPEEIFNLFMLAIKEEKYLHYWLSKQLFFVLMEQKDKRLNRPDLLQQLAQNFLLIIEKMIYAKPFILYFIFSVEKLAKANQLTVEIIDAIEPLTFEQYVNQSIPRKRLLQIEEKIQTIVQHFRAQQQISA